jgi:hypothetical protein
MSRLEVPRGRPGKETASTDIAAASVTQTAAFDAAHAVHFLDAVFGDVNSGRLGLSVMKPNGRWGQSQHFQWLRFAAAWADQQDQAKPAAIYFRATMLPPEGIKSGRGGEADSHALAFLWGDVDYGTVGHKPPPGGLPLPPDEEAARKVITRLPTPSLIINSGGGLYPTGSPSTSPKRNGPRLRSGRSAGRT